MEVDGFGETRKLCLFCDVPKIENENTSLDDNSKQSDNEAQFWICARCKSSEKERTRALEAQLLAEADNDIKMEDKCADMEKSSPTTDNGKILCTCENCCRRRALEAEQRRDVQELQRCWVQLRHAVRQCYRDQLVNTQGLTAKGKTYDVNKLRELVKKLCLRDPHQLYQRLESQVREFVMEKKVQLLQIIIAPGQLGLDRDHSMSCEMSMEQTSLFIRSLVSAFIQFQKTARNMKLAFLEQLESEHLKPRFELNWDLVNRFLFATLIHQESLIEHAVPKMLATLGIEDVARLQAKDVDLSTLGDEQRELVTAYRLFDQNMKMTLQAWERSERLINKYTEQQMLNYKKALLKKQRMLKQDLDYFKKQRELLELYVRQKGGGPPGGAEADSSTPSMERFLEALREYLLKRSECDPAEELECCNGEASTKQQSQHREKTAECPMCQLKHCPCDECVISHLVTCGLIDPALVRDRSASPLLLADDDDDTAAASLQTAVAAAAIVSSSASSVTDDDDDLDEDDDGAFESIMDTYRQQGKEFSWTEASRQFPATLYHLHGGDPKRPPLPAVHTHYQFAYGDWEAKSATALASARQPTPSKVKTVFVEDVQTQLMVSDNGTQISCVRHRATQRECVVAVEASACRIEVGLQVGESALRSSGLAANPEMLSMLTEESIIRAVQAFKARAKAAAIGSGGHWTAKDEAELRQKIRDGHEDVMLELSRMAKQLRADPQQSNTVGTQVAEDSLESIENDAWRDRSLSGHNRGSSHCDCCYCEVFGHGTGSSGGLFGPNRIDAHYPQMRDRLRLKLKQKKKQSGNEVDAPQMITNRGSSDSRSVSKEKRQQQLVPQQPTGAESLDELLEYINGGPAQQQSGDQQPLPSATTLNGGAKSSSKAAKRQRQKQRKEERARIKQQQHQRTDSNAADGDEVKDSNDLNETDLEVEQFKRFMMDCRPLEKREKVTLNLGGLVRPSRKQMEV